MAIALPRTRIGDRLLHAFADVPPLIAVASLSLCVSLALFGWLGTRHGNDSARYLDGAARLMAGQPLEGKQASYAGYVAIVGVVTSVGADARLLVLFQILIASLAGVALYDLGRRLSGRRAGVIAAVCFGANVDIVRWHLFVLTDSLYISLVVLSTWLVHQAAERRRWWYAAAAVALAAAATIRPNGWVLVLLAVIYWLVRAPASRGVRFAAAGGAVLAFLAATALVGAFRQGIQAEAPDVWLRQGTVIWNAAEWRVPMPDEPVTTVERGWTGSLGYAARHPVASTRLALTRMAVELSHVRPFYSTLRNVLAAASVMAFYPFALLGAWQVRAAPLARLMGATIGGHLLIVALTFADWDGRFLLYFLPLVYVFAACDLAERLRWRRRTAAR